MSGSLREILPYVELRRQDQEPAKYPARFPVNNITLSTITRRRFFDDTNSIVFRNSQIQPWLPIESQNDVNKNVSFPSGLRRTSKFLMSDMTSSLSSSANIKAATIEQFVAEGYRRQKIADFRYRGFSEVSRPEQNLDKSGQFYSFGTPIDIAPGFSSNLGSKTQILLTLPVLKQTNFGGGGRADIASQSTTVRSGSVLYYNVLSQAFDIVGHTSSSVASPGGNNNALFNAIGQSNVQFTTQLTGTFRTGFGPPASGSNIVFLSTTTTSSLVSSEWVANSDQLIRMSQYLTEPFLLEAIAIKLPLKASASWFLDYTVNTALVGKTGVAYEGPEYDLGGPAITVGLQTQFVTPGGITRDIIFSSSIIPLNDNRSFVDTIGTTVLVITASAGQTRRSSRTPAGFLSFGTPGAIVAPGPQMTFTGSISLFGKPTIINGFTSVARNNLYSSSATVNEPSFMNSEYVSSTEFGRSIDLYSGRTILGKNLSFPSVASNITSNLYKNNPVTASAGPGAIDLHVFRYQQNVSTPYLLMPNDNIILSLSKSRSALRGVGVPGFYSPTFQAPHFYNVTTPSMEDAHDVGIDFGAVEITLYGSQIRNGVEYHDSLHQRLTTNEIHEVIGNDPVVDQFDIEHNLSFVSSSIDRFTVARLTSIYGNNNPMIGLEADIVRNNFNLQDGDVPWYIGPPNTTSTQPLNWSRYRYLSELKQITRQQRHIATEELFWDSRIPNLPDLFRRQNPLLSCLSQDRLMSGSSLTVSIINTIYTGYGLVAANSPLENRGLGDLLMSFPFGPRHASIQPTFSDRSFKISLPWNVNGGGTWKVPKVFDFKDFSIELGSTFRRINAGEFRSPPSGLNDLTGMTQPEFIKTIFGIGDGIGGQDNNHVLFRYRDPARGYYNTVELRGWKYGMLSAFPLKNSYVFRRDSFGQHRDMLEQGLFTKFGSLTGDDGIVSTDSVVTVKFVNQLTRARVAGNRTFSSNLHFECSSSLPYFDGIVRNREEPLSLV